MRAHITGLLLSFYALTVCAQQADEKLVSTPPLTTFGSIKFTDPNASKVELPSVFVGDPIHGTIRIVNDSDGPVTVTEIESSCGCATAVPEKRELSAGEATNLIVRFASQKPGAIKSTLTFTVGGKQFVVQAFGEVKTRLVVGQATIAMRGGTGLLTVKIVDKNLNSKQLTWTCSPGNFRVTNVSVEGDEITGALLQDGDGFPSTVAVLPRLGKQPLAPLGYHLKHEGVIRVLTKRVYIERDSDAKIIMVGDVDRVTGTKQAELRIGDTSRIVPATFQSHYLILRKPFSNEGRYSAEVTVGGFTFPVVFTVR